jgi:hypothetical protein
MTMNRIAKISFGLSDGLFPMARFLFAGGAGAHRSLPYSRWGGGKSTATPIFISTARLCPRIG